MRRGICRVKILSRTSMWWRDRSHQTHTWTRSVGGDFLWWRKIPSCTVMSTTKTKRWHHTAGKAHPPMVRLHCACVCGRVGGQRYDIDISPHTFLFQAGSGLSRCRWNTTGRVTVKIWSSWRERAGEVSGRQRERGDEEEREAEKGWVTRARWMLRWVGGYLIISSPSQISTPNKIQKDELACQNW